jgi:hypothetical protein
LPQILFVTSIAISTIVISTIAISTIAISTFVVVVAAFAALLVICLINHHHLVPASALYIPFALVFAAFPLVLSLVVYPVIDHKVRHHLFLRSQEIQSIL